MIRILEVVWWSALCLLLCRIIFFYSDRFYVSSVFRFMLRFSANDPELSVLSGVLFFVGVVVKDFGDVD